MSNPGETNQPSTTIADPAASFATTTDLAELRADMARANLTIQRVRRQMRVTWLVASLASIFAFVLGARPEARAQFGVTLTSLNTAVLALQAKTASMSVLTDPNTSEPTVRFSGVNVQVVSGSGSTSGGSPNSSTNGVGNLIVGYNELRGNSSDSRIGSHNLIVGTQNSYSSYGGTVIGAYNTIGGESCSVLGGAYNTASGAAASVSAGYGNTASNNESCVSGGDGNTASGFYASVSGGFGVTASGYAASVSGGYQRTVNSNYGWVAGSQASGGFTSGNFSSP